MIIYEYEIPDPDKPVEAEVPWAPSGALRSFVPEPLDAASLVGSVVEDYKLNVGTYGMGGPGFFGLRLGENWLVVAIWGASEWMLLDDRFVTDGFHEEQGRPPPWFPADEDTKSVFRRRVVSRAIEELEVGEKSLRIAFGGGSQLRIDEDAAGRPNFRGTGKPRAFKPEDDLRRGVFLAPTTEIWV